MHRLPGALALLLVAPLLHAQPQLPPAQPGPNGGRPPRTLAPREAGTTQQRPSATRGRIALLTADIDAIIGERWFRDASWGVSVVSCDNGEILYQHEAGRNRQFASNMKLLTTATALRRLGPDYRFQTELYLSPESARGRGGDLVVRTLGDPSLSPSYGRNPAQLFERWGALLDSLGIRSVQSVTVDPAAFDDVPYGVGWSWDDEPYGFNAPISAAAVYDNGVEVRVTPGARPGDPAIVETFPATRYVRLASSVVTSSDDSASIVDVRRERGSDLIEVSGSIVAGGEPYVAHMSIEDPPLYFATLLGEELERRGITVRRGPRTAPIAPDYAGMRKLAVEASPPLREIVAAINKQSLNLGAEMLTKELGRVVGGRATTEAGTSVIGELLSDAGIDLEHVRVADGSGLSRQSMIAPGDMVRLLRMVSALPQGPDFIASLSVAGIDGTLGQRLQGTLAAGNVRAKTGFLSGVRGVSGYVRTRDGELLAFSLVVNNYSVPTGVVNTAQDLIMMRLASFTRRSS